MNFQGVRAYGSRYLGGNPLPLVEQAAQTPENAQKKPRVSSARLSGESGWDARHTVKREQEWFPPKS